MFSIKTNFHNKYSKLLLVLFLGFILRVLLSYFGTLKLDQNTFIAWSNVLVEGGLKNFYAGWSDYLPGYLYILWFLGKAQDLIPISQTLLFKLPAIISDVATGFLIYKIVSKVKNEKLGLLSSAFYVFNPAVLANSTLWGQVDSLTSFFSLLSVYLLPFNFYLSAIALSLGTLIKPQAAFAAPVILYLMIGSKWKLKKILGYTLLSLGIFVLGFIPFSNDKNLALFIFERIKTTLGQYPYTSVNAFNFWGIFGFWQKDTLFLQAVGALSYIGFFLTALNRLKKEKNSQYILLAVSFLLSFLFFTRMHERHFLPTLAPLIIFAFIHNLEILVVYFGFSLSYVANLYYAFNWITYDFARVFSPLVLKIISFLNLAFSGYLFFQLFQKAKINLADLPQKLLIRFREDIEPKKKEEFPKATLSKKQARIILILILTFSFIARIAWIKNPRNEYFDEVYHAFTARTLLNGDPKAWEWWNTPPEGFAYEWTHPPLAKEGMVLGMLIFGENSFGWRIPQVLLGVGAVFLVYLFAKTLFKDEALGLISAGIFSLDGLPLVMSRIGMNDSYFLFFVLLSLYLFFREKNFLSALAFGLAAASKWSSIWAIPIFLVMHFSLKRKITAGYFCYFVIPPLVYLGSYIPMFTMGHTWENFIEVQKQMWWYHTRLKATHPFTSQWWSWPILKRPIWLYTSGESNGFISNIYAMGNPIVFWSGFASVFISIYYSFRNRSKNLGLIVFSYLIFFVPWAASPRIMFLYHYLPSIPFLTISLAHALRKNNKYILPFFFVALLAFLYFFPRYSGLEVPIWLDESYHWFPSW